MKYYISLLIIIVFSNACYGQKIKAQWYDGKKPIIDSSKIYWAKYNKYKKIMNDLIDEMNAKQDPKFDKRIYRYEDSCKKYSELLNKLKK